MAWTAVDAFVLLTGGALSPFSSWTTAVVVAGVGQVLLGSLAYLVPVLVGAPLEGGIDVFQTRGWLPLVSVNAAGIALIAGFAGFAVVGFAIWLIDFAWRLWQQRQNEIDR